MALRKPRERRYTSPTALAEDVRHYLVGQPLVAGPESGAYIARKFLKRHRPGVIAAIMITVLAVGGVSFYLHRIRAEQQRTLLALKHAEEQTKKAEEQAAIAFRTKDFLGEILRSARPDRARGQQLMVIDVLREMAKRVDNEFQDLPHIQAQLRTTLGESMASLGELDDAKHQFEVALDIRRKVFGPDSSMGIYSESDLGDVLLKQGKLDEAQSCFTRMADIYRSVYDDKHYVIGIALANLASVYVEKKQYAKAEGMFQEVLQRYSETLPPDHQYVGIARIRLGRALVRDQRYREAEGQTHPGYEILMKLKSPPERWLKMAREDLLTIYNETKQPDKATIIQSQIAKAAQSTSLNDAGRK